MVQSRPSSWLAQVQNDAKKGLRSEFEKKCRKEMEEKIRKAVEAEHREALAAERQKRKDVEKKCEQFKQGFEAQTRKLERERERNGNNKSNGSMVSPAKLQKRRRM